MESCLSKKYLKKMQIYMVFLSFDFSNSYDCFCANVDQLRPESGPTTLFFLTSLGPDQGPPPCDACFPYGSYAGPYADF